MEMRCCTPDVRPVASACRSMARPAAAIGVLEEQLLENCAIIAIGEGIREPEVGAELSSTRYIHPWSISSSTSPSPCAGIQPLGTIASWNTTWAASVIEGFRADPLFFRCPVRDSH